MSTLFYNYYDVSKACSHLDRFRHAVSVGVSLTSGEERQEYQLVLETIDSVNRVISQGGVLSQKSAKLLSAVYSEYEREQKNFAAPVQVQSSSIPSAPPKPASECVLDQIMENAKSRTIWLYPELVLIPESSDHSRSVSDPHFRELALESEEPQRPPEKFPESEPPPLDIQKARSILIELRHAFVVGAQILPSNPSELLSCEDIVRFIDLLDETLSSGRSLPRDEAEGIQAIINKYSNTSRFTSPPQKHKKRQLSLHEDEEQKMRLTTRIRTPGLEESDSGDDCGSETRDPQPLYPKLDLSFHEERTEAQENKKRRRAASPDIFSPEPVEEEFFEDEAPEYKKQHRSSSPDSFSLVPEDGFVLNMAVSLEQMHISPPEESEPPQKTT